MPNTREPTDKVESPVHRYGKIPFFMGFARGVKGAWQIEAAPAGNLDGVNVPTRDRGLPVWKITN
jgi:hypothetical protein